jgi:hypothetical protein
MGFSVSKIFIETTDQAKVKEEIQTHVKALGSKMLTTNEEGAIPEKARHFRTFVLSPVLDGKVAIWEDGGTIADMTLAQHLSKALATKTYWMQLAPPVAYAGYCRYQDGKLIESKAKEGAGLEETLQKFAEEYKLPWFWDTYKNPNGITLDLTDEIKEKFAKEHGFANAEALMKDQQGMVDFMVAQTTGEIAHEPALPEATNGFIAFNLRV